MGAASDAFLAHCETWNRGDREGWLALFAEDVTLDDPVGRTPKLGPAALETTWERSHRAGRSWQLRPQRMHECGDEVAVDLLNVGVVDGREVVVPSIEIWKVDGRGRVIAVRSFFESDPAVHDPYYLPEA